MIKYIIYQVQLSSYTSHEIGINLSSEIEKRNIEISLHISYSYWHMCNVKKVLLILEVSTYFSVLNLCLLTKRSEAMVTESEIY